MQLVQQAGVAAPLLYFCSRLQQLLRPSGRTACAKPNPAGSAYPPVLICRQKPVGEEEELLQASASQLGW